MKRLFFLAFLTLAAIAPVRAQKLEIQMGNSSFVSLLTCGAGNEFYTTWGHSAIRICDPELNLDIVYNYGTFDFDTPHFYLRFAQGRLDYCLSRDNYGNFLLEYAFEKRTVWEQRLNLTLQERNNLLILLEENYLPENRYYKYDFFRDNCATRVRDIINNSLCHRNAFVEYLPEEKVTYRDLLYAPTETYLLWWRLGVDLVLGQRCDKVCSNMECMFSPFEMMNQVDTVTLKSTHNEPLTDSVGQPLMLLSQKTQTLGGAPSPLRPSLNPTRCFWLLFVVTLALTIFQWAHNNKPTKRRTWKLVWFDELLFWIVGLISLVLIFLWFGSDHYCTKWNWNLLWANPLWIYFALRLRKSHRVVLYIGMVTTLATLVCFHWLPQTLNAAVIPICLTLLLRLIDKFQSTKSEQTNK